MRDVVAEFREYLDELPVGTPYTGVGSRDTPRPIAVLMCAFAIEMRERGFRLRSGGADGADLAFESGAGVSKEIYLPFSKFNGSDSKLDKIPERCFEIASNVHPAWGACNDFAAKAHSRNVMQVFGADIESPTEFVVCWTKDGAIDAASSVNSGGTRTAIVLAEMADILVLNMARSDHLALVKAAISEECLDLAEKNVRMKGSRTGVFTLPLIPFDRKIEEIKEIPTASKMKP